jgi:hypothetical protein
MRQLRTWIQYPASNAYDLRKFTVGEEDYNTGCASPIYRSRCDKIFVIDKGSLIEYGAMTSLISGNGYYAKLWEMNTA